MGSREVYSQIPLSVAKMHVNERDLNGENKEKKSLFLFLFCGEKISGIVFKLKLKSLSQCGAAVAVWVNGIPLLATGAVNHGELFINSSKSSRAELKEGT